MARKNNKSISVENNDVEVKKEQKDVVEITEENSNNNHENTMNNNANEKEYVEVVNENKEVERLKVIESFRDKYNNIEYNVDDILEISENPKETVISKDNYKIYEITKERADELLYTSYVEVI